MIFLAAGKNGSAEKFSYFVIFAAVPFLLWIVTDYRIHFFTFVGLGILYILSRHIPKLSFLDDTLEIVILYLILEFLLNFLGVRKIFPFNRLIVLVLLFVFILAIRKFKAADLHLGKGKPNVRVWGLAIIFIVLSVAGLAWWFLSQKSNAYTKMIPDYSPPLLILAGLIFAIINAVFEEGFFRSILFSCFTNTIGIVPALFLQAVWFSLMHYQSGFPSGLTGIALTFIFALMMGYLVIRKASIRIPVWIHFAADFSIFCLVVLRMHHII